MEEHQNGILATIAVHLFIITLILILKIRTYTEQEYQIMIDLSQVDMEMPIQDPQEQENIQEMIREMRQEYNIPSAPNIPVNVAENRAIANIDQMVRDIKTEMNITDPPRDRPEEIAQPEDRLLENEARIYEDKYPTNAEGERTIYKGPTTISYELEGRRHVYMPIPVYKCQGQGKIVVSITVNREGYVLSAKVNASASSTQDICLTETAIKDAERSRFNISNTADTRQQGTITYQFVAQ